MSTTKTPERIQPAADDFDPEQTVPVSVRLPAKVAYHLYLYAEQMNTSAAKIVTSVLEDALPAFEHNHKNDVRIRISQVYKAMYEAQLIMGVNEDDLRDRVLKRTEPGGPIGRPKKVRKR